MSQFYGLRREVEGDGNESDMSTVSLWDMKTKRHQKSVSLFQPKQLVGAYNTIFVRTETALVVLDTSTMLSVDVTFDRACEMPEQTALWLNKELHNISVLASRKITRVTPQGENVELYRMVFTADNKVYLLDRPCLNSDDAQAPLNVTTEVVIAGRATEACYISEQVGFVIVVTLNEETDMNYRDHLYWYSTRGELRGVLPFLGKGPHSLYSVYLSGDENQAETEGWYLYFTDGHGAICCIKLH
ncbi:uncharacterized protein [Ptychodera flava]|uniref:uncharacterized protein n=1 Tax=Ptychodera flava TaxID=63121 RepID=UPI00396A9576